MNRFVLAFPIPVAPADVFPLTETVSVAADAKTLLVPGCAVNFEVPDDLREKAGIPEDAPLHVELLDDGEITISMNHDSPGLWDVPVPMMLGFLAAGVCPSALEDVLEAGEIMYGA